MTILSEKHSHSSGFNVSNGFTSNVAKFSSNLLLIFSSATTKVCHETDKAALLDFKKSIFDEGSEELLKYWNKDTNRYTQWDGVLCNHSNGGTVNKLVVIRIRSE